MYASTLFNAVIVRFYQSEQWWNAMCITFEKAEDWIDFPDAQKTIEDDWMNCPPPSLVSFIGTLVSLNEVMRTLVLTHLNP